MIDPISNMILEFLNGFLLSFQESFYIMFVLIMLLLYSVLTFNIELIIISIILFMSLSYYYRYYMINKKIGHLHGDIIAPVTGKISKIEKNKNGETEIIIKCNMLDSGVVYPPCVGKITKIRHNKMDNKEQNNILSENCDIFSEFYNRLFNNYLMDSEIEIECDISNNKDKDKDDICKKIKIKQYTTSIFSKIKYFNNVEDRLYIDNFVEDYTPLGIINHNYHITRMVVPKNVLVLLPENTYVSAGITKIGKFENDLSNK